jgi:hypothetical protein
MKVFGTLVDAGLIVALAIATALTLKVGAELQGTVSLPGPAPIRYLAGGAGKQLALARCPGDLRAMLGDPPPATQLAAVRNSLARDNFPFIPLYALTLLLTLAVTARGQASIGWLAGLVTALIVGTVAADVLENRAIVAVVQHIEGGGRLDDITAWPARYAIAKWVLLSGALVALATINLLHYGVVRRLLGSGLLILALVTALEQAAYIVDLAGGGCAARLVAEPRAPVERAMARMRVA